MGRVVCTRTLHLPSVSDRHSISKTMKKTLLWDYTEHVDVVVSVLFRGIKILLSFDYDVNLPQTSSDLKPAI